MTVESAFERESPGFSHCPPRVESNLKGDLNCDVHLVAASGVVDISVLGAWHDPRIAPFP